MPWVSRGVAGAAVLLAGGAHLWAWAHGYRHTPVAVPFLVDAGASLVAGALVLVRGDRVGAWAGTALSAAALLSYGLARTVGLFGFVERAWTDPSLVAAGCEAVALVLLLTEALVPPDTVP